MRQLEMIFTTSNCENNRKSLLFWKVPNQEPHIHCVLLMEHIMIIMVSEVHRNASLVSCMGSGQLSQVLKQFLSLHHLYKLVGDMYMALWHMPSL